MANNSLLRFSLVGVVGFLVDAGALTLVIDAVGPYWGRLISFVLAVLSTWILNRNFTFAARKKKRSLVSEIGQYFSAMIVGGIANYALYAGLVSFVGIVATWPILGVAAGSLLGLAINYSLAKNWVFGSER